MTAPPNVPRTPRQEGSAAARIAAFDPEDHFEEIARLLYACEFSWDIERALEFALFRTFAVPLMFVCQDFRARR